MSRTLEAPAPAQLQALRTMRVARGVRGAAISTPVSVPEFDAAAHQKEIARVAYRIWMERAHCPGSPEDDLAG